MKKKQLLTGIIILVFIITGLYLLNIRPLTYDEALPFFSASFSLGLFIGPIFIYAIAIINEVLDREH